MHAIKLDALDRWKKANKGELISLGDSLDTRRVRLHVNSQGGSDVYLVEEWGLRFLAQCVGLQTVEFYSAGRVELMIDPVQGEAWWHCAELEPTCIEIKDPAIFTEIAGRRRRNPELEEMMFRMQMNVERRIAMQRDEYEAQMNRLQKEIENGRAAPTVDQGATSSAGSPEVRAPVATGGGGAGEASGNEAAGKPASGDGKPAAKAAGV